VVGGDGTMLGVGRHLARYGTPLIGINQGAWASSPTSAGRDYQPTLQAMLRLLRRRHRPLMQPA
jgi:NAD+ kinase